MIRVLAWIGLVLSSAALIVLFPVAVVSGEFMKDLGLAIPGLLFWLLVFGLSYHTLFRRYHLAIGFVLQ